MIQKSLILVFLVFLQILQATFSQRQAQAEKVYNPQIQKEGDDADVMRIIGSYELKRFDPFLMLDFFKVRLPSGFPDHPHRGFETVTYMLSGSVHHEDFRGNKGVLEKGDVQWMTAGKGIVHSEMPGSYEEDSIGFQLWINLKSQDKMIEPQYQEYKSDKFPVWRNDSLSVKIISGQYQEVQGIINTKVSVKFLDVHLDDNKQIFRDNILANHSCLIFIYEGSVKINERVYTDKTAITFQNYIDVSEIEATSESSTSKLVLLCGQPINEPVFNYGPFVLETQAKLRQAFQDFQLSQNGFEGANNWSSEIKNFPQTKKRNPKKDL